MKDIILNIKCNVSVDTSFKGVLTFDIGLDNLINNHFSSYEKIREHLKKELPLGLIYDNASCGIAFTVIGEIRGAIKTIESQLLEGDVFYKKSEYIEVDLTKKTVDPSKGRKWEIEYWIEPREEVE